MPNINIHEVDYTTAGASTVGTDIVYIPGYANQGPVNEPVLCETLDDFIATFGAEPYTFIESQAYPQDFSENAELTGNMYEKGDKEKSFIYAYQVLAHGLPVLYERVLPERKVGDHTVTADDVTAKAYIVNNEGTLSIVGKQPTIFMQDLSKTVVQAEGATEITLTDLSEYGSGRASRVTALYATDDNDNNIVIVSDSVTPANLIKQGDTNKTVVGTLSSKNITLNQGVVKTLKSVVYEGTTGISTENSVLTISAKEIGPKFMDISVSVETKTFTDDSDSVKYVSLHITDGATSETIEFTYDKSKVVLDRPSKIYYYTDITSKIVDFTNAVKVETLNASNKTSANLTIDSSYIQGDLFTVSDFYTTLLKDEFWNGDERLVVKSEYTLKYLTTGAYPVFEYTGLSTAGATISALMLKCATTRTDCVALIDHTNNTNRALTGTGSVYESAKEFFREMSADKTRPDSHGTIFTPWIRCNVALSGTPVDLPASFGYLTALGEAIKTSPNFLATAGVTRGVIPDLIEPCQKISAVIANKFQPEDDVAINAITNIKPYGYVIWGNRTGKNNALDNGLTATSFLNVRNIVSDISKLAYQTAVALTYEQNSGILWTDFVAGITPLLDRMVTGNGLSGYNIQRVDTTERAKIKAKIIVSPIEPVEDFDIEIALTDAGAEVETV